MNCARAKSRPSAVANERAARVLPSPGKSSSSTWPLARMPASTRVSALPLADDGATDLVEHALGEAGDVGGIGMVAAGVSVGHGLPRFGSGCGRSRRASAVVGVELVAGGCAARSGSRDAGEADAGGRARPADGVVGLLVAGQDAEVARWPRRPGRSRARRAGPPLRRRARRRCRGPATPPASTMATISDVRQRVAARSRASVAAAKPAAADDAAPARSRLRQLALDPDRPHARTPRLRRIVAERVDGRAAVLLGDRVLGEPRLAVEPRRGGSRLRSRPPPGRGCAGRTPTTSPTTGAAPRREAPCTSNRCQAATMALRGVPVDAAGVLLVGVRR